MRNTTNKKKIAPIVVTVLVILYVAPLMGLVLAAMGLFSGGERVNVMFPLLCWLVVGGAVIVGVVKALLQRLREIDGGEEEEASQY